MTLPIKFKVPPLLLLLGRQAVRTRRVWSLPILLLRTAADIEVHGGLIEARSVTNHVTLRPLTVYLAPPEGGTRCKTKLLLP